jgi:NAD(P)-dependent dehydrogenase (short-subunit alcohol dehydrogenase family)
LTALALLKEQATVIASMRSPTGKNRAVANELAAAGAHVVEMDVAVDASVENGVRLGMEAAKGIDVVVNNAGVGVLGLQESFTPEDWRKLFDINVFGVQRVNRAILPHMRAKRSGLLLHVSSLLGRMALPFYGPYNASKWALEALAENYRVELSGIGIDVCVVEPGGYPTTFIDRLIKPSDPARASGYGALADAPAQALANFERVLAANPVQHPQLVADAIVRLIHTPAGKRPFRTVVDAMGMGAHIGPYNEQLETVMSSIYANFGMGEMLTLKVPEGMAN